ncbi:hypothetical protein, partial [Acetobacter pasteurianus]|uniref:hypothetical protein n=1 Tax=Acetobacter pasteurianus TaxID=438 RepID=UPI001BDF7AB0
LSVGFRPLPQTTPFRQLKPGQPRRYQPQNAKPDRLLSLFRTVTVHPHQDPVVGYQPRAMLPARS